MAGIKSPMWGMFPEGHKPGLSQDDWQRNMIMNHKVFCKLCGAQIHAIDKDEFGKGTNWEAEMQNEVHAQCYFKFMEEQRQNHGPSSR